MVGIVDFLTRLPTKAGVREQDAGWSELLFERFRPEEDKVRAEYLSRNRARIVLVKWEDKLLGRKKLVMKLFDRIAKKALSFIR